MFDKNPSAAIHRVAKTVIALSAVSIFCLALPACQSKADEDVTKSREMMGKNEAETKATEEKKEDIRKEAGKEIDRRKQIYDVLSHNPEASKIVAAYKSGATSKDAARSTLQVMVPQSLGALPPSAEDGNWAALHEAGYAQVKASVECFASGTKANGSKASKLFSERIELESRKETVAGKDGKPEEWGFSKAELVSDGEKQKPSLVVATPEYAVLSNAVTVGTGFERRLLVVTYMLDLKAMQLTRIVNSLPPASEERTSATCTAK